MRMLRLAFALLAILPFVPGLTAQEPELTAPTVLGLTLREIGPALTSGRISDFAVNPENHSEYYVATASGGVWKTVNAGTTFEPIFEGEGSYSIGSVTLDPSNPNVVWVGTGENNGQRSVAYGDGVYKSVDGGRNWERKGLEQSEHIGQILVDPRDSDVVFVAAQGPLWSPGGDRGLYKTADGGETWIKVLEISENTGVNEVVMDPRDPDVMYASAWQRRRHVWTFIGGGPESGLYKSTDGGENWRKITSGLPSVDLGRIGLCVSPVDPDYVYAIVEAADGKGGFYRSTNRGGSFERRSDYSTSGNYYQEIVCDLFNRDRVYSMNTWGQVTNDGGATFGRLGEQSKHVDNHAMWIDPHDPDHYLNGNDGGVYETWDRARTWHFKGNLPVTQFYKVALDNDYPFYNVYGGTQDNFSLGGPSRNTSANGIVNADWVITNGGDGFESQVDPTNPDIVFAQSQYGGLVRYDRKSGEQVFIQPQPGLDEPALRWNWDAPLLISPHSPTRLYFSANKVFRSDDRGDSWTAISDDLSRQIDRNTLEVMGRVWSMDAVAKNRSTTIYGNIVAFDESPLQEDLLYVGTDDGLVQVTADAGGTWQRFETFPGVPERTYVNMVLASRHDTATVYAAFNNHKNGDFRPYLLKSTDNGRSWRSIASDLPERGSVYSIAEDPVVPDLLFVGTEFGLQVSRDGGGHWVELGGGLPTIAVRDLAIQERESDLVLGTFGRGFWVLDDYSALREATPDVLAREASIFPVRDALAYIEAVPLGLPGKSFQGESYFNADNPPFGAVFTWYLKDAIKTRKELRQEAEKEVREAGRPIAYPSFEEMRAEDDEEDPYLLFTVTDASGAVVRRLKTSPRTGFNRIAWDLRYPPATPVDLGGSGPPNPFASEPTGPMVAPGTYRVALSKVVDGVPATLTEPLAFNVVGLNNAVLAAADRDALVEFQMEAGALQRDVRASARRLEEASGRIPDIKEAIRLTASLPESMLADARALEARMADISIALNGDRSVARRQFETPPSIMERVGGVVGASFGSTGAPSPSQREQLRIARESFRSIEANIDAVISDLEALESRLRAAGAPYTRGRRGG
ncbi:MAG: hypothetical protein BMS9Abin29_0859 [Gemmatimonadota bacterium]|nr:MAG: hypothetical protein BMS9Abin29_0859 [Gemmatimonadota bacterium]